MANLYKRYSAVLPALTQTTVLTVPVASTMIIRSIWLYNPSPTMVPAIIVEVERSPSGLTVLGVVNLTPGQYLDVMSQAGSAALVLEAGDRLVLTSSIPNVYAYVSSLIVDRN